jgi:predicted nucleotide-binding protein
MYYHVRVTLKPRSAKAGSSSAFEVDLSREDLLRVIAVPFMRKTTFYCGGTVIEPGSVEAINFNETSQPSSELLPFIRAERARSGIITFSDPTIQVTFKGKDITRELLDEAAAEAAKLEKTKAAGSSAESSGESFYRIGVDIVTPTRVFVVRGHDIPALDQTELLLRRWGLEPVIVRDKANKGMTVIEKIEANSDVGYAIVLLTPDDVGGVKGGESFPRARQNVIWEWGYLVAKLGRDKVACLCKDGVELPSDLHGIVRINIGNDVRDQAADLAKELRATGYRPHEE